jgi:hypothetical protein
MKTTFQQLPAFECAFFTAAFWTADDEALGGMDYRNTGNAGELWERLHPANKTAMLARVRAWKEQNAELLTEAEGAGQDEEQNGHDLHLTAQGHGVGFWDRGLGELGERLTEAARKFGYYEVSIDSEGVFIE